MADQREAVADECTLTDIELASTNNAARLSVLQAYNVLTSFMKRAEIDAVEAANAA